MIYEKTGYLNNEFRIFHLKDQSNRAYNYHYHDFDKILLFISGDVEYSIEGRNYDLLPGDIVLINAGSVHRPIVNINKTYERIILYISKEYMSNYKNDIYDLSLCFAQATTNESHVLRLNDSINKQLLKKASKLYNSYNSEEYANDLYLQALFLEFMIELNRAALGTQITFVENHCANSKIIKIIDYINNNLCDELNIDTISKTFYISRYHLMHSFKEETGYTIGNYITIKRLLLSRELIKNGSSVTDACYACGFKNYSTFSRAYKKHFNKTAKSVND